jgi:hypothetical protein
MPEDDAARTSFEAGARTAREAMDRGTAAAEEATRRAEQSYSSTAEGMREFNTKLLDIAQANTMARMNFISELTHVKGPTEAIELWSKHAQSQVQRLTEQSRELATLCQRFASSSTTDAGGRSNVQTRIVRPETHGAHFQCRVKRLTGPAWRRHIDCSELATSRQGPPQGA